ncbi:unnamed protein product, partial [Rotaria magnacalcarata]
MDDINNRNNEYIKTELVTKLLKHFLPEDRSSRLSSDMVKYFTELIFQFIHQAFTRTIQQASSEGTIHMATINSKHSSGSFTHKSLSNSSLGDSQILYCLCRSSDCSTFMIACDACNIWYHGSCIGVSEKESAKIENFFCHRCR